jgi:hypothetical protein
LRNNVTHWNRVARTRSDLLSIRDGLACTEIYEVVLGREGCHLSGHWWVLAILVESWGNQLREKGQGLLWVLVVVPTVVVVVVIPGSPVVVIPVIVVIVVVPVVPVVPVIIIIVVVPVVVVVVGLVVIVPAVVVGLVIVVPAVVVGLGIVVPAVVPLLVLLILLSPVLLAVFLAVFLAVLLIAIAFIHDNVAAILGIDFGFVIAGDDGAVTTLNFYPIEFGRERDRIGQRREKDQNSGESVGKLHGCNLIDLMSLCVLEMSEKPRVEQHRCGVIRTKKGWLEKKRKRERGRACPSRKWLR